MRAAHPRLLVIAERLLARLDAGEVDLVEDFTTRYPLAVLCDLLDIPDGARRHRDAGLPARAHRLPDHVGQAVAAFADLAGVRLPPFDDLRHSGPGGSTGSRLHALPVLLR